MSTRSRFECWPEERQHRWYMGLQELVKDPTLDPEEKRLVERCISRYEQKKGLNNNEDA